MGYNTTFKGSFVLDKPLTDEHRNYLYKFAETRRMKRFSSVAETMPDELREAVGIEIGPEGAYFVGGKGFFGQNEDRSILNFNAPPSGQPSLWCQWAPNEEGTEIQWDGGEKFYSYTEWIVYIINHFLRRWGYTLNGEVVWHGEDPDDHGKIVIDNNGVREMIASVTYVNSPFYAN